MNFAANKNRYFYTALFFACLSVLTLLTVAVRAWNNPTQAPSGGSGLIGVSSNQGIVVATSTLQFSGAGGSNGIALIEWGAALGSGKKLIFRLSEALNDAVNMWEGIELHRTGATTGNVNLVKISGNVGIREGSPLATLSLGDAASLTNNAVTLIAHNNTTLGTTLGSVTYPFEFRASSPQDNRLLLMNYRRVAGSDWQSAGWRLQSAVDNLFTGPTAGKAYLELYNGASGELYFGTAGFDRMKIWATGVIDVLANRITNLGNPTIGSDAATKDYVDRYGGVGGSSSRLWGQGRPSAATRASGGECDSSLNSNIKVSRSEREAHWDSAAAACPVGWWVCTEAERGINFCNNAGVGQIERLNCKPDAGADTNGQMLKGNSSFAWVADVAPATSNKFQGRTVNYDASPGVANEPICSVMPVWCCAFK